MSFCPCATHDTEDAVLAAVPDRICWGLCVPDIYHFAQVLCVLYCLIQWEMHAAVGWRLGVDLCLALCAAFCLKTDGVLVSCLCCVWQHAKCPFLQPAHTCAVSMLRCWHCIQGWHCRKLVHVHLFTAEDSCYLCLLIALGHACLCCPACGMHAGELLTCTGLALHADSHVHNLCFQLAVCLLVHAVCRVDRFAAPCCDDAGSCLCVGLVLLKHQHMEKFDQAAAVSACLS